MDCTNKIYLCMHLFNSGEKNMISCKILSQKFNLLCKFYQSKTLEMNYINYSTFGF